MHDYQPRVFLAFVQLYRREDITWNEFLLAGKHHTFDVQPIAILLQEGEPRELLFGDVNLLLQQVKFRRGILSFLIHRDPRRSGVRRNLLSVDKRSSGSNNSGACNQAGNLSHDHHR